VTDAHIAHLLVAGWAAWSESSLEMDFDPQEAETNPCRTDLHSNNGVLIVSDEEDRIAFNRRMANDQFVSPCVSLSMAAYRKIPRRHQRAVVGREPPTAFPDDGHSRACPLPGSASGWC
jgi:hypothetical protein